MINLSYYKRTIGLALYEVVDSLKKNENIISLRIKNLQKFKSCKNNC